MKKRILVLVDTQKEFINGALGNAQCEAAVPNIVREIRSGAYEKVVLTQDTHGADYLSTQEGKRLPVLHGQEQTEGYQIHEDIIAAVEECFSDKDVVRLKKPTFGSAEVGRCLQRLVEELEEESAETEIMFTGFCTGICVISNVVMAKAFCPENRVCVIADACACVTPQTHETALEAMKTFQTDVIYSRELL